LRFALAPKPVLSAFEKVVRPLRAQMEINLAQSRTLATIRDALLPRLMSGEVRVKGIERLGEIQ
jgi:type I restriction enzyme, S subunit